jgi:hypothetical protein
MPSLGFCVLLAYLWHWSTFPLDLNSGPDSQRPKIKSPEHESKIKEADSNKGRGHDEGGERSDMHAYAHESNCGHGDLSNTGQSSTGQISTISDCNLNKNRENVHVNPNHCKHSDDNMSGQNNCQGTGQNSTGQNSTGQNSTGQNSTGRNSTGQNNSRNFLESKTFRNVRLTFGVGGMLCLVIWYAYLTVKRNEEWATSVRYVCVCERERERVRVCACVCVYVCMCVCVCIVCIYT